MSGTFNRIIRLISLCALLWTGASALQVVIMDRDLQSTLGTGQSVNGRLSLQLAEGASGPVVVFIKDDAGQTSSFPGELRGGQIMLKSGSLAALLQARGITLVLVAPRPLRALPTPSGPGSDGRNK